MQYAASASAVTSRAPRPRVVIGAPSFPSLGLWRGLTELPHYRDLMYTLSLHRIKVRYKQSVLGLFWAILQPVAMMLIFTSVFSLIARMPSGPVPYALFAYAAILPWTYFASSVSTATNALVGQAQLVTKVYFPREILPLTYVTVGLFDFLIASLVMIPLMAYYNISPTSQIVWVVPIVIVLTGWITAVSLCLSAIQVRMRDIGVAMPLLLQLWMFASPVIYALSSVPARFRWWYELNPMTGLIENFRRAIIPGPLPDPQTFLISTAITGVALPLAYGFFKYIDATVADVI